MFLLSHHHPDQYDRCYQLGGLRLCARCLGTYPVLVLALALQLAAHAPLEHPLDVLLGVALVVPATLDWAFGQFHPHRFSNPWRSATGALLGIGLGRSLYIHLQRPWPVVLLAQAAVVTLVAFPVILTAYRRKSRG